MPWFMIRGAAAAG